MLFTDVVARLEDAFTRELPGAAAQAHLAPVPRRQWPDGFSPEQIRHAAGLLLVFPKTNTLSRIENSILIYSPQQIANMPVAMLHVIPNPFK